LTVSLSDTKVGAEKSWVGGGEKTPWEKEKIPRGRGKAGLPDNLVGKEKGTKRDSKKERSQ